MKTDEELIESYESGNESAFSELVERHLPALYTFLTRMVGSREEAEDIAQNTFLKAWKYLRRYKKGANFKTWLFAIARNSAIDHLRKKKMLYFGSFSKNESDDEFEHSLKDMEPLQDISFDAHLKVEALEDALQQLSPLYREIILLHYREGLTLEESSKVLGIPLNTAKSRDR